MNCNRRAAVAATGVVVCIGVALAMASSAMAIVREVSFTSRVATGDYTSLTVKVTPVSRCTIKVTYDTVVSQARGLGAKRGGTITWRWRVGTNTHLGRWPVKVDCGKSGRLTLWLRVV